MKFHWGTGIFIFLAIFIFALGFILYKSKQVDNTLVLDKYYEEDLKYQSKYEKINNYVDLTRKVNFKKLAGRDTLQLVFPYHAEKSHAGTVTFYRANDSSQDKSMPVQIQQDSVMNISLQTFAPGKWTIKIDWMWGKTPLYTEYDIIL